MHFTNKTRRSPRPFALAALLAAVLAVGCTTKDDTLGANLVPDNQQMQAGYAVLQWHKDKNPKQYVRTRLYQTDSIVTSNLATGYMGTMHNDTVGLRKAGFLSQFSSYYLVDDGYFGYMPIFDSAQILLSITGYGRDTLTEQTFEVYEVISNDYLTEKPVNTGTDKQDSIFYMNFNPEEVSYLGGRSIVGSAPLFEFTLGGKNSPGPSTTAVTMRAKEAGKEFIKRLMLQTGEHKDDYAIYDRDNIAEWFKIFKGLYIKPTAGDSDEMKGSSDSKGSIYATDLTASGFSVYGRNRVKEDPSLIQDTIGMVFYFNDTELPDCGNVSINRIVHDYAGSQIDIAEARAYNPDGTLNTNRPVKSQLYVEGLGGVVTEIDFTQEFFDDLQALIDKGNNESGKDFRTLAFTQVQMEIYFPGGQYDWTAIDPSTPEITGPLPNGSPLADRMTAAPSRLGMYTHYWRRINIADYNYTYESYYDTELAYGGRINRSHGCYRMDITSHVQEMWNEYLRAKQAAGEAFDFETASLSLRKIYLGPEVTDLFTNAYAELQGSGSEMPIRFTLAYNLVK